MDKKIYQNYFKGKKITIMGLGLLGRGIAVTKLLAKSGAKLIVTDLKTEKDLKKSLTKLKDFKIQYRLGEHNIKDFENRDLIIKSAGVPLDSIYIKHSMERKIPVEMDASLFVKIIRKIYKEVKIIGITGTRGKSTTTALIYHILNENKKKIGSNVFLGGNMRNKSTLPILEKIENKDIVVLELDSWQCQGFGDSKISPDISVFTSFMPDHMNYYKNDLDKYLLDKSYIYRFQKKGDVFVTNKNTYKILKTKPISKTIIVDTKTIKKIKSLKLNIFGEHNINNASLAFEVLKCFNMTEDEIIKSMQSFKGIEGRCQILDLKGQIVINDNNSTTPEATLTAIKSCKDKYKNQEITLIAGGSDKNLNLFSIKKGLNYVKNIILLSGTGADKLKILIKKPYTIADNLKDAVYLALHKSNKKDIILFSPGFASFGMFKNEYDRNDQFIKIIKKLNESR
jgi:UDP-N-acetylmuramoylalanine--D-glutamate ligase